MKVGHPPPALRSPTVDPLKQPPTPGGGARITLGAARAGAWGPITLPDSVKFLRGARTGIVPRVTPARGRT